MTTTAMLDKTADHPEIWLEPKSDDYDSEGRMWCQDNQWGTEGVRYVLAPLSHAAGDVAGLYELIEKYEVPCWAHDLQQMPRDVIRQHFREFANEVSAAISARAEAAEALEQDAARYRWLRAQQWYDGIMAVVCEPKETVLLGTYCPSGQLLDEAIDAAIAARSLSPIKEAGRAD